MEMYGFLKRHVNTTQINQPGVASLQRSTEEVHVVIYLYIETTHEKITEATRQNSYKIEELKGSADQILTDCGTQYRDGQRAKTRTINQF